MGRTIKKKNHSFFSSYSSIILSCFLQVNSNIFSWDENFAARKCRLLVWWKEVQRLRIRKAKCLFNSLEKENSRRRRQKNSSSKLPNEMQSFFFLFSVLANAFKKVFPMVYIARKTIIELKRVTKINKGFTLLSFKKVFTIGKKKMSLLEDDKRDSSQNEVLHERGSISSKSFVDIGCVHKEHKVHRRDIARVFYVVYMKASFDARDSFFFFYFSLLRNNQSRPKKKKKVFPSFKLRWSIISGNYDR